MLRISCSVMYSTASMPSIRDCYLCANQPISLHMYPDHVGMIFGFQIRYLYFIALP